MSTNSRMVADRFYPSETLTQQAPEGSVNVVFVEDNGQLLEVFIHLGKAGSVTAAWCDALQNMINYLLSQHVPFRELLNILSNLTSGSSVRDWNTGIVCRSGPEAVYLCCLRYIRNKQPFVPREESLEYSNPFNLDDVLEEY